jgi:hypothetical protein
MLHIVPLWKHWASANAEIYYFQANLMEFKIHGIHLSPPQCAPLYPHVIYFTTYFPCNIRFLIYLGKNQLSHICERGTCFFVPSHAAWLVFSSLRLRSEFIRGGMFLMLVSSQCAHSEMLPRAACFIYLSMHGTFWSKTKPKPVDQAVYVCVCVGPTNK